MEDTDALVQRILKDRAFRKSGNRRDLFTYLAERQRKFTPGMELWEKALENPSDTYGVGESLRQSIGDLRNTLGDLFPPMYRGMKCELPDAVQGKGYRLEFSEVSETYTEMFWQAHLWQERDVMLVVNQPLFFRDTELNMVFRCIRVDPEKDVAPKQSLKAHRADAYKESLEPVFPYFLGGEIGGRDAILKWFSKRMGVVVTWKASGNLSDHAVLEKSLILLGDSGINRFIDSLETGMVGSESAQNMGWIERTDYMSYRVVKTSAQSPFGFVRIYNPSDEDRRAFPDGEEQVTSGPRNDRIAMYVLKNDPKGLVYGVVSRFPNQYNHSAVTIIHCPFADATEQIAVALTDDAQMKRFSSGLPWESGQLPETFEGLFAMRLGTPGLDIGALRPQQVQWKAHT